MNKGTAAGMEIQSADKAAGIVKYCSNCGAEIMEGAGFCSHCGTAVTAPKSKAFYGGNTVSQAMTRMKTLEEMEVMLQYFGQKRLVYNQYEEDMVLIENLSQPMKKGMLVAGIILICILWFFSYSKFMVWSMLIIGVGCIAGFIVKYIMRVRNLNKAMAEEDILHRELLEHYEAFGYCPIGFEYSSPVKIHHLMNYVKQGRADDHKEAMNLFKDEGYKEAIGNTVEETLRVSKAIYEAM